MKRLRAKQTSVKSTLVFIALLGITSLACAKLPRKYLISSTDSVSIPLDDGSRPTDLINLNTASRKQLERLPGIGQGLAARIVAHREQFGRFRRPEHLMMVRGISDRKFREMRGFIIIK